MDRIPLLSSSISKSATSYENEKSPSSTIKATNPFFVVESSNDEDSFANNSSNICVIPASEQQQKRKESFLSMKINKPCTPLGQVVEAGEEQTGRWTREEYEAFLSGLKKYGKEWKKVAAQVKTCTVVQTRTHAQKYFQKL